MPVTIGSIIRQARMRKRLSQEALADLTDVTPPYISRLESNHGLPSDDLCFRLGIRIGSIAWHHLVEYHQVYAIHK